MSGVILGESERRTLLSLQNTHAAKTRTSKRLATGEKVSDITDNAKEYLASKALTDRAEKLLERLAGIEQAVGLVEASISGLRGARALVEHMLGLVTAATDDNAGRAKEFDGLLEQLNTLIGDARYQGVNLLTNQSTSGYTVATATRTVEFSDKDESELVIGGDYAGSSYYLSTGGSTKLVPNTSGDTMTAVGGSGTNPINAEGTEFQVNTTTANNQSTPAVAGLSGGGWVSVWADSSNATDPSGAGVIGQLFDSDGNKVGGEFLANTTTGGDQYKPVVTALDGGGFAVAWESNLGGAHTQAQAFDASGNKVGGETTLSGIGTGSNPAISSTPDGGYVVSWSDASEIAVRRFDASGSALAAKVQVNTSVPGVQDRSRVTGLSGGGFVVTWADPSGLDGNQMGVFGQLYDASGAAVGSNFQVNTVTGNDQYPWDVEGLSGGGFVVTFQDVSGTDGNSLGVFGQIYDSNASAVGGNFQINTTTAGQQDYVRAAALSDGGFVAIYSSQNLDGSGWAVAGQQFDSSGSAVGSEFQVNTTTAGSQWLANVTPVNGGGGFVVVWEDMNGTDGSSNGVFGQRYSMGVTAGAVGSVSSANYPDQVTVTIGGTSQTLTRSKMGLGIANAWYYQDFSTADGQEAAIDDLEAALSKLDAIAQKFTNHLGILKIRGEFTKNYTNTLNGGASQLTVADLNEEAANQMALQTRESMSMNVLSLMGQASRNIVAMLAKG